MKALDSWGTLQELARATGKPHMYISFQNPDFSPEEQNKCAPYLEFSGNRKDIQIWSTGWGYILFDTDEEMELALRQTIGDDGPTNENPYKGPARCYACTCYGDGELGSNNT